MFGQEIDQNAIYIDGIYNNIYLVASAFSADIFSGKILKRVKINP